MEYQIYVSKISRMAAFQLIKFNQPYMSNYRGTSPEQAKANTNILYPKAVFYSLG